MKKGIAWISALLLGALLCLVGYAASPAYDLNDVLTAMDALRQKQISSADIAAYDQNKDGSLRLDDVLQMLRFCKNHYRPADCALTHRDDHDCVLSDITLGRYTDLSYTSSKCRITMNYRIYVPRSYSPDKQHALVVFLHGLGSEKRPISELSGGALFRNIQSGKYEKETILLVPQCPVGMTWPDNRTTTIETAYEIIDMLASHLAIDRDRMYLSGHSNGAKGVAYMVSAHPGTFAAGILSAGASPISNYKNLEKMAKTPMRLFCSNDDPYKFNGHMKNLTLALQIKGGDAVYKEYTGLGYGIFTTVSNEPGLIDWMYKQTLAKQ